MATDPVPTTEGVWTTEFYEVHENDFRFDSDEECEVSGSDDDAPRKIWKPWWLDADAGVNIKLVFRPGSALGGSVVRLLQFKLTSNNTTKGVWEVDRLMQGKCPWFGFTRDGDTLVADAIPRDVREKNPHLPLGGKKAQQADGKGRPAFLIDTVRDPTRIPQLGGSPIHARFWTFAYDCTRQTWLGGVEWGFSVHPPSRGGGRDGPAPSVHLSPLQRRPERSPAHVKEGLGAMEAWNKKMETHHKFSEGLHDMKVPAA